MPRVDTRYQLYREQRVKALVEALGAVFAAQAEDVLTRVEAGLSDVLPASWDERLADALLAENRVTAEEIVNRVIRAFGGDADEFDWEALERFLSANAELQAQGINGATRERLEEAESLADVEAVLAALATTGVGKYAATGVTGVVGFGALRAAMSAGATAKVWKVNSGNPRSAHAAVNGSAVPIDATFANGMEWPGDWSGGPAQTVNCQCSLVLL